MSDEDDIFNEDDYEFDDEDDFEEVEDEEDQEEEVAEEPEEEPKAPVKKPRTRRGSKSKKKAKPKTEEPAEVAESEAEPEAEPEPPEEEEEDVPPDDDKAVAALRNIQVRLDVNEKGNVWRVIYDDRNGTDDALLLLGGLPGLKEVWLLGTKVTKQAAEDLKTERPKLTVYH